MIIVKNPDDKILKDVAKLLKAGAIIVFPTDTAYGLGCDATNAKAVKKIFAIKGRSGDKGLPVVVANTKMAKKFFLVKPEYASLVKYWPAPLSIVLGAKKGIAKNVLQKNTAAVRIPNLKIASDLSLLLGRPITATSANISGAPTCYSVKSFLAQKLNTKHLPDIVLDIGSLTKRKPSTIVGINKKGKIEVLRLGSVKLNI